MNDSDPEVDPSTGYNMAQWRSAVGVSCKPRLKDRLREHAICGISHAVRPFNRFLGDRRPQSFGILMYHRVAEHVKGLPAPTINVTPQQFRRQLEGLLKRGHTFWSLKKVLEHRSMGYHIPGNVVVITFDDAFAGVFQYAYPILCELKIPATIFVSTAFISQPHPMPFDSWGRKYAGRLPEQAYRAMTWSECEEVKYSGLVRLGAHTHTHRDFRNRPGLFAEDLKKNLDLLDERLDLRGLPFAFPFGTPRLGFNAPHLVAAAREMGVTCALSTEARTVCPNEHAFQWGRLNVFPWDTGATLSARLNNWYSWLPGMRCQVEKWIKRNQGTNKTPQHQAVSQVFTQNHKSLELETISPSTDR